MSSADPRPRLRAVPGTSDGGTADTRPLPAAPQATAVAFSETVRQVVALARRQGLRPPVYRSPPRLDGVDRSIRRRPNGTVVVAVRRAGRPLAAIQSDVIDGVVAANELRSPQADRFRRSAWAQLQGEPGRTSARGGAAERRSCARVA